MKLSQPIARYWPELAGALILCGIFLYWDLARGLYVLLAFAALGYTLRLRPRLGKDHIYFSLPIYLFFGAMLLAVAAQGFDSSGMNALVSKYLLLLLAIPLAGFFFIKAGNPLRPWLGYLTCSLLLGITAAVDLLLLQKNRADGGDNAAIFGFVAVAIVAAVAGSYPALRKHKYGSLLYVCAIAAGLAAIMLSGTRGSWIAAIAILSIAAYCLLDRYSAGKRALISLGFIAIVVALGLSLPQVQQRIERMTTNLEPYINGEQQSRLNSTSYRIEGWKVGFQIGLDHPLLGVGPGHFRQTLGRYVETDERLQGIEVKMRHAHNQYVHSFATGGIIGLAALLILLISHLILFARFLSKRYPNEVRSFALTGFLLVVAYILLGLTGVPLERKKLILVYALSSATCWGSLQAALQNRLDPAAGKSSSPG